MLLVSWPSFVKKALLVTLLACLATGCSDGGNNDDEVDASATDDTSEAEGDEFSTESEYEYPFVFACAEHVPHSAATPLLVPPFDIQYLLPIGTNAGDASCDVTTNTSCVPGGAMYEIGGAGMGVDNSGHIRPTPHNANIMKDGFAIPLYAMADSHFVSVSRFEFVPGLVHFVKVAGEHAGL